MQKRRGFCSSKNIAKTYFLLQEEAICLTVQMPNPQISTVDSWKACQGISFTLQLLQAKHFDSFYHLFN